MTNITEKNGTEHNAADVLRVTKNSAMLPTPLNYRDTTTLDKSQCNLPSGVTGVTPLEMLSIPGS